MLELIVQLVVLINHDNKWKLEKTAIDRGRTDRISLIHDLDL